MSRSVKPVAMGCVTIGYQHFLMPFNDGMKLVALMQNAVECRQDYSASRQLYIVGDQPTVEFSAVKPQQIVMPSNAPRLPEY